MSRFKSKFTFAVVGLGVMGAVLLSGCGSNSDSGGNIAIVDGQPITMKDFLSYIQRKNSVIVATAQGPVQAHIVDGQSFGFQALRDMIIDKIIEQIAKDEKVYPTDAEVANELQFQQKVADLNRGPNIVTQALAQGFTTDSFKHQILISLCKLHVLTKGITIPASQIDDYIKQHPDNAAFEEPPRISALMILAKDDKAKEKVDAELKKGSPFLTVSQTYSVDPEARNFRWHYHLDNVNVMPKQVRDLLSHTDVGQATNWVQAKEGWVKFYIENKVQARPKDTANAVIHELVRRALAQQQGEQTINFEQLIQNKIKQNKDTGITVTQKNYQEAWKRLVDQVVQAPAPGTAPGANTPGASTPGASSAPGANAPASSAPGAPAGASSATPPAGAAPATPGK